MSEDVAFLQKKQTFVFPIWRGILSFFLLHLAAVLGCDARARGVSLSPQGRSGSLHGISVRGGKKRKHQLPGEALGSSMRLSLNLLHVSCGKDLGSCDVRKE